MGRYTHLNYEISFHAQLGWVVLLLLALLARRWFVKLLLLLLRLTSSAKLVQVVRLTRELVELQSAA